MPAAANTVEKNRSDFDRKGRDEDLKMLLMHMLGNNQGGAQPAINCQSGNSLSKFSISSIPAIPPMPPPLLPLLPSMAALAVASLVIMIIAMRRCRIAEDDLDDAKEEYEKNRSDFDRKGRDEDLTHSAYYQLPERQFFEQVFYIFYSGNTAYAAI